MRTVKFTDIRSVSILNEAEAGLPVNEIFRKNAISSAWILILRN